MVKRLSPTAIGVFVIGSLAPIITALVVLGSGRLFTKQHRFVCFFQGSLNGLKVGAPVKVRGVQVGSVAQILLRLPPSEGMLKQEVSAVVLPVIIEIDESQLKSQGGTGMALRPGELDQLIKGGLRAQLATESILTGLLYVDLDFHPDTPVNLELEPGTSRYPEIPTVPTNLQQVQETAMRALAKLDKIDFAMLIQSTTDAATAMKELLSSPDLKSAIASLKQTTANLDKTVVSVREVIDTLNTKVDPLLASLTKTSDQANRTLTQTSSALAGLNMTFAPDSPLVYHLDTALEDLSAASNSIRDLTDYLQRNPSALVRGKYLPENPR
jgi:paraquat-inducible protein B